MTVVRYFEMWNSGDVSIAPEILSAEWIDHAHPELIGVAAVQGAVAAAREERPGLHFEIDELFGDSAQLAVFGTVRTEPGAPATRLVWHLRLKDGLLTEMRTYRDTAP
ncbi:nuclear transport factor 2 family protein [Actinocorallia lasiicapitis]